MNSDCGALEAPTRRERPKGGITLCPTCGKRQKRSNEANRRYWSLVHLVAEGLKPNGQQFSPQSWHTYFKGRYIGMDEIRLPSGQVITQPLSSADLDVVAFNGYMLEVEVFAAENGIYLEGE